MSMATDTTATDTGCVNCGADISGYDEFMQDAIMQGGACPDCIGNGPDFDEPVYACIFDGCTDSSEIGDERQTILVCAQCGMDFFEVVK